MMLWDAPAWVVGAWWVDAPSPCDGSVRPRPWGSLAQTAEILALAVCGVCRAAGRPPLHPYRFGTAGRSETFRDAASRNAKAIKATYHDS